MARSKLLTGDLAAHSPWLPWTERRRDAPGRRFVPATNNGREQQIGLNIKERYRAMRSYKSEISLRRVVTLTAYLRDAGSDQALIQALAAQSRRKQRQGYALRFVGRKSPPLSGQSHCFRCLLPIAFCSRMATAVAFPVDL